MSSNAQASIPTVSFPPGALLDLIFESDPHPHDADPSIHPVTGQRLIPLHLVQADHHLSPPIKPMGWIPPDVLVEMIAFEKHRHFPVFTFFPRLSPKDVVPGAVRCIAFDPELVKVGKEALGLAMEALTWFMRDRGSMKKQARRYSFKNWLNDRSQGRHLFCLCRSPICGFQT